MTSEPKSILKKPWMWWPVLAGPLGIASVYVFHAIVQNRYPDDPQAQAAMLARWPEVLEAIAPAILTAATAFYWLKAIVTRNLTYTVIGVLVGCLLLRELHWRPELEGQISIKDAIYPLLGVCFFWMFYWMKLGLVDKPAENPWHTIFFVSAIITYIVAQLVEKRVFLRNNDLLHSHAEEIVEVLGHVLILCAAVFGSWKMRKLSYSRSN